MTMMEEIQLLFKSLPPEKQSEALDFIKFLYQRGATQPAGQPSLKSHPAFGAWKHRQIDAVEYQRDLRAEWDAP